jgi:cell division protein FtsW (lipid II flippase)
LIVAQPLSESSSPRASRIRKTSDEEIAKWRRGSPRKKNAVRRLLLILGLLALAIGLLWIGQGTGAIPWPQSSFMIDQIQWAGYGVALAAFGLILIWQSKR